MAGNGRQNHKFNNSKNEAVYFCTVLVLAGTNGNTCGQKLRGDKKQLIDLEWPNGTNTRKVMRGPVSTLSRSSPNQFSLIPFSHLLPVVYWHSRHCVQFLLYR